MQAVLASPGSEYFSRIPRRPAPQKELSMNVRIMPCPRLYVFSQKATIPPGPHRISLRPVSGGFSIEPTRVDVIFPTSSPHTKSTLDGNRWLFHSRFTRSFYNLARFHVSLQCYPSLFEGRAGRQTTLVRHTSILPFVLSRAAFMNDGGTPLSLSLANFEGYKYAADLTPTTAA
jgi:hypothetical protein